MPFHLSPVRSSRRRFLSTLAAGGAALGLGGRRADGADGPTGEWVAFVQAVGGVNQIGVVGTG